MNKVSILCVMTMVITVAACSGPERKPPQPMVKESFNRHITKDGSKMFQYVLTIESRNYPIRDKGARGGHHTSHPVSRTGPPKRGDKSLAKKLESQVMASFKEAMSDSNYCRSGYLVLDKSISRGKSIIRGECKDGATAKDRARIISS